MSEICFTNILNSAINQSCVNEVNEYEANAWLVRLKDCTNRTIDNFEANIDVYGDIIPVFYPGDKEWQTIKKEGKRFKYGVDYTKTVEFVVLEQTPKTEQLKRELSDDAWVLAIKQVDADKVQLIGLENGLRFAASKQDLASVETHGALEVTMTETSSLQPLVSYSGTVFFKYGFEYITGLSIAEDGKVSIQLDTNRTGYCRLPNGTVLTSTNGLIDTTWGDELGHVIIAIDSNNLSFDISTSDFIGELNTNATTINVNGCTSLTSLSAPNATFISANSCSSLTSLSAPKTTAIATTGCSSLMSLSVPNATNIYATGCSSLTSLSAPNATTINAGGCTNISAQSIYNAIDNAYTFALSGVTGGYYDFTSSNPINLALNSPIHHKKYSEILSAIAYFNWSVMTAAV